MAANYEQWTAEDALKFFKEASQQGEIVAERVLQPVPSENELIRAKFSKDEIEQYRNTGLQAIASNKVAVLVLCGGQATRLGADRPKGIFDLGLPEPYSTLLAHQAAQILRLKELANKSASHSSSRLFWYVMVSKSTHAAVAEYLSKLDFPQEDIVVFEQAEIPAFDFEGRLFRQVDGSVFTAPNGNGGIYEALQPLLPGMQARGIEYVHTYCVDNVLCRVGDPIFIGAAATKKADCMAKVVEKKTVDEKVGVCCLLNNKPAVVEYTELPEDLASQKENDKLLFRAGSIANHVFSLDFLKRVCALDLPYHIAQKKIPYIDQNNQLQKPDVVNGVKFERFIFDVFPYSQRFFVYEVERNDEFSPLKNADSAQVDCPSTCRKDLVELHKRWLKNSNVDLNSTPIHLISPTFSYDGEDINVDTVKSALEKNPQAKWICL